MNSGKVQKIVPLHVDEQMRRQYRFRNVPVPKKIGNTDTVLIPCISFYRIIPLYQKTYFLYIATPNYERWYLNLYESEGQKTATLMKRSYTICTFLNYMLYHTSCNAVHELTLSHIRGFIEFYKKNKDGQVRSADSWREGIAVVHQFLIRYQEENKNVFSFSYHASDLYTTAFSYQPGKRQNQVVHKYNKLSVASPGFKKKKYRFLVQDYLDMILLECKKHDPMLTLAVALQSYAGLREGEIVNLSVKSIQPIYTGYGRIGRIQIDLTKDADFLKNWKGRTGFGSIKGYRIQEVYTDFTDTVMALYEEHEKLLTKRQTADSGSALFLNEWGRPLSVESYRKRVKNIFFKHFLPALRQICTEHDIWAENAPYIETYEQSYPGAHMFRHWFTMYLLTQANLSAEEISKWRGDSNLNSMVDYIHVNARMIEIYKKSVFVFQKTILEEIL